MVTAARKLEDTPWKNSYDKPKQHIKKTHHFANKGSYSLSYGFSSSHVQMWELNNKKGWSPKNWYLQTVMLEKILQSPLDSKEIKPVNSKENQPWIFIGRTDAETEALILWPPDENWLIWKDPDAGKSWGQEEKRVTEDEMIGWHHQLNGHEFEQTQEVVKNREAWHAPVHGVTKSQTYWATEQQQLFKNQLLALPKDTDRTWTSVCGAPSNYVGEVPFISWILPGPPSSNCRQTRQQSIARLKELQVGHTQSQKAEQINHSPVFHHCYPSIPL